MGRKLRQDLHPLHTHLSIDGQSAWLNFKGDVQLGARWGTGRCSGTDVRALLWFWGGSLGYTAAGHLSADSHLVLAKLQGGGFGLVAGPSAARGMTQGPRKSGRGSQESVGQELLSVTAVRTVCKYLREALFYDLNSQRG